MREYLEIGPAPSEEEPVQLGSDNYVVNALHECRRFIDLIRTEVGPEPEGARLEPRSFNHDFGRYIEVVCYYDPARPEAVDYAFRVDENAPARWKPLG